MTSSPTDAVLVGAATGGTALWLGVVDSVDGGLAVASAARVDVPVPPAGDMPAQLDTTVTAMMQNTAAAIPDQTLYAVLNSSPDPATP